MAQDKIAMYGTQWCIDCFRAKEFFARHDIGYRWIDVDQDESGLEFVVEANHGKRIVPTIVFEDGSTLAEPSDAELAIKLGISV